MNTLLNRVLLMRQAGEIERCHAKPHLLRYSNAHHTHGVETLVIQCWREDHNGDLPRAELIVAAHIHDAGEIVTGDVPSPIKDLLGEALHAVDHNVEQWLQLWHDLTEEEQQYLDAADRFELWMWCWDEMRRGNREFLDWIASYNERWLFNPLPEAFEKLRDQFQQLSTSHLSRAELNKAGGLS